MLHYEAADSTVCIRIHAEVSFPLQMVFPLGQAGREWKAAGTILVEQQPRAIEGREVARNHAKHYFTTDTGQQLGARGSTAVNLRHGVSRVLRGTRYTLGIIFHAAK
jgi:hypothetical protein